MILPLAVLKNSSLICRAMERIKSAFYEVVRYCPKKIDFFTLYSNHRITGTFTNFAKYMPKWL